MSFSPSVYPTVKLKKDKALLFAYQDESLLVDLSEGQPKVPLLADVDSAFYIDHKLHFTGVLSNGWACYAARLEEDPALPDHFSLAGLRELSGLISEGQFRAALTGKQVVSWAVMHKFCGRCGARTDYSSTERAKHCPACGAVYYPRISPAVIAAITREGELLLLKNKQFKRDFYSVLAGFVEPGETLEECLVRETREEAGIEIKNIRYFGSQPWPFPGSLMVGFTAEYAGGLLRPDGVEIAEARWFKPENFPKIPGHFSIARKLIDAFVEEQKQSIS